MKVFFFIFLTLNLASCLYSQDLGTKYYFKEVDWELTIPNDFQTKDSLRNVKLQEKGLQSMEKANNVNLGDLSDLKTLVSAFKGAHEYFNATIRRFNKSGEGNYDSASRTVNRLVYNTFLKEAPDAIIDTSSTKENIGGLIFNKFQVTLNLQKKDLFTIVILSKLYRDLDFGITYLFQNEATKNEIEGFLQHSNFKK